MSSVDVVTVPDFTGAAAARFEFRTRLFLRAWMRHERVSRAWPLHLVCIGDPPAGLRGLARQAGASVTVHAQVQRDWPRTTNKLRAFDIAPTASRFLLLDTDVLVLNDLTPLASAIGDGLGLGPTTFNPLSEEAWERIFAAAAVPYPGPVGNCWAAEWDFGGVLSFGEPPGDSRRMPPCYNSGVVFGSWGHGLGAVWRTHLDRILGASGAMPWDTRPRLRRFACQYGLATAAAALTLAGVPVRLLPLTYQVRPPLLQVGAVAWSGVTLFHYAGALRPLDETTEAIAGMFYGRRLTYLRRMVAARFGLRAARAPILRALPEARLRALEPFYDCVSRLMLADDGRPDMPLVRGVDVR